MIRKAVFFLIFLTSQILLNAQVHTTYLWHLQQPIYWPEAGQTNPYHFQAVKESQDIKNSGGNQYGTGESHPLNDLQEIFSKDDRKNVYQHVPKNCVQQLTGYPEAGAQVNYSGCLIDNVNSLANAGQWGYYSGWNNNFSEARGWTTTGGNTRLDITGFTYHHALSPLVSERALAKEIQAHRHIYAATFGTTPNYSKGYWPAECAFSERIIKVLVDEGFEWSIVANSHLSRTLNDYPLHYGTNGCNISPPNKADVIPTNGNNWWNGQIDGRGGEFAAPYCYQVHKAKYVDPETGIEYKIDVVPMADLLSYRDGYSPQGTGDIDSHIAPYDDPTHPSLVLFAHDGDNAWGGGSSYYFEAVPNFVSSASSQGYVPTTIQQFLTDHPVPADDIVHVEDGSWVNAANDWGHPQFINWMWPLYNTSTYEFNPDGWTEDARNWAVITAIDNYVIMAEDLAGSVDISDIVYPSASASNAEMAWHFYMPALTSGYMYYGKALDMEVKQTIAGNNAISYAQVEINAHSGVDNTPPSVFIPQRFPYNPGGKGFGPIYGYQEHTNTKDFTVWTYAYDVNGITSAVLKYRCDEDGTNPLSDNINDTYAGGSGVSAWESIPMTKKILDTGNVPNDPEIDFFVLPTAMSNMYYAKIENLSDTLVDYYVEVTDTYGNTFKTPIQHVYVGDEDGGGSSNDNVFWEPTEPTKNEFITITATQATAVSKLHWAVTVDGSNWTEPIADYWTTGTVAATGGAVQTPFTDPDDDGVFTCVIGPFNNASQIAEQIDFVIKIDDTTWDNNNGSDYHITINNVVSDNPVGSNQAISMLVDETYDFSTSNFYFQGVGGATFAGIKIITVETNGDLEYNGTDISANTDYADVTNLSFAPNTGEFGSPYANFTFQVKDSEDRYSDNTYTFTINVTNSNPSGANGSVTIQKNETYDFSNTNFSFSGVGGVTFAGIKIVSEETAGTLTYDGSDVTANTDYSDMTLLQFVPETDAYGTPYSDFTFQVKDSENRYSDYTYTMTINVVTDIQDGVSWFPENPTQNDVITIFVNNDIGMNVSSVLHWGINAVGSSWTTPIEAYQPSGTTLYNGTGPAVETFFNKEGDLYSLNIGPFNNDAQTVNTVDFVLHYGSNSWNNNGGLDWHIPITHVAKTDDVNFKDEISIYPNPVTNFAYINIDKKSDSKYILTVKDILGKELRKINIGGSKKVIFYRNNLKSGMYFLHFRNIFSDEIIIKKIIID